MIRPNGPATRAIQGIFALACVTLLALLLQSCDLLFPPSFRVIYHANGATSGEVPVDSGTYKAGTGVTVLSAGNLAKSHGSFSAWCTTEAGDGARYSPGQTITMGSSDVGLYATWSNETSYGVTYDANGATSGSAPIDTARYYQGDQVSVASNSGSLAKTGKQFSGWNTRSDGTGTARAAGSSLTMGAADLTLYAKWDDASGPFAAIGGSAADVSVLNARSGKYVILSVMPGVSAQGYGQPPTAYSYTISSTASAASVAPSRASREMEATAVYPEGQVRADERNRQLENEILASGARQRSAASPRSLRSAPAGATVGTVWSGVNIQDSSDAWKTISTTCRYVSDHAFFFVDDRDIASMETYLAGYGTAFDSIYDVNRAKFGNERDTDSNGKVIIVFSRELGNTTLGYFYSIDKYPTSTYSHSNEGDIFYVTTYATYQGDDIKGTLAHEFQHMIYFDEHYDRSVYSTYAWLNEALSQAAEYYNGYTTTHLDWIRSFLTTDWKRPLNSQDTSYPVCLTYWTSRNYGYGAVFVRYLIAQYGDTAIKNMCSTNLVGIAAVESATSASFNTIFTNFMRAIVMSGTGDSTDPKYAFGTLDLHTTQTTGRGGLLPWSSADNIVAGSSYSYSRYPYQLDFFACSGSFSTMTLSGTDFAGSALGLTY